MEPNDIAGVRQLWVGNLVEPDELPGVLLGSLVEPDELAGVQLLWVGNLVEPDDLAGVHLVWVER